jgi:hypothetical protein
MGKRPGNPNWGKTDQGGPVVLSPTSFEHIASVYGLTPDQYLSSSRLREWARLNKNSKYVPENLLEGWGLKVDSNF